MFFSSLRFARMSGIARSVRFPTRFWSSGCIEAKSSELGGPLKLDVLTFVDYPTHSLIDRLVVLCFRKIEDRLLRWIVVAPKI